MNEDPKPVERIIADRYRVESVIGQGGTAIVFRVFDTLAGRKVALKRLRKRKNGKHDSDLIKLFRQEYHILTQLAHPRVVEVYDYGVDNGTPYYTMELLEGGDLRRLSPLPWKRVCSLLCDICSALSLLHSRRRLHHDLSPRNVHCTRDGKAKLIDFGAMTPIGPCHNVVGTPAYTPPEVVYMLSSDVRADVFSLGATAYYALTDQNAYPARDFSQLREAWMVRPPPPSSLCEGIPKELDDLVMSMISIDPMARPSSATELFEKLSAIASLEIEEHLLVAKSYLVTPTLIGREEALQTVRDALVSSLNQQGRCILVRGPSGVGRSRFLDACVLEAKLVYASVLRADATDSSAGNWGAIRSIVLQALKAAPEDLMRSAEPLVPVLGHVLPELVTAIEYLRRKGAVLPESNEPERSELVSLSPVLLEGTPIDPDSHQAVEDGSQPIELATFESPQQMRTRVQHAMRDLLLSLSERRFIVLAIDDAYAIDESSMAIFALLAREIRKARIAIVATFKSDTDAASPSASKLLHEANELIDLGCLNADQVGELLRSLFADAPNCGLLADRLYDISQGNPRAVMQISQHLVP